VASVGLLAAMRRFDPERGPTLAALAIPTILGELKRYFRDTGWSTHVPRGAQELARLVERGSDELARRTRRTPSVAELAGYLELDLEDVLTGLQAAAAHHALSLDAPAPGQNDDNETGMLADELGADDDRFAAVVTRAALTSAARHLTSSERRALALRLDRGLKQADIAPRVGCSQMQVSRLLRSAATNLQQSVY
jgi:RNA polymerase sigma-B factor